MTVQSIFGLDLGKQRDFTALTYVERHEWDLPYTTVPHERRVQYACRSARRWPLGTAYTKIVDDVKDVLEREWYEPVMCVDASGLGQPVVDYIRRSRSKARVIPVTIVGGVSQSVDALGYWNVAKVILITNAQLLLQQGRLLIAAGMPELTTLLRELQNYRVDVTKAGNEVYSAREGEHDDLVLSLCMAVWWGERAQRRIRMRA